MTIMFIFLLFLLNNPAILATIPGVYFLFLLLFPLIIIALLGNMPSSGPAIFSLF